MASPLQIEPEICKGCRTFSRREDDTVKLCTIILTGLNKKCPCSTCIVKMTCETTICPMFQDFANREYGEGDVKIVSV